MPCGKGRCDRSDVKPMVLQDFPCPDKKCGQTLRTHGNTGPFALRQHIRLEHPAREKSIRAHERKMAAARRAMRKVAGQAYASEW